MLLSLYKSLLCAGTPFVKAYLGKRTRHGKEDAARAHERRGHPQMPRPAGQLVWCHAASVGESVSLLALVKRMLSDDPSLNIMVTTGTVTSAKVMAERLPKGAFHQFIPVDHPRWVKSFLNHWQPDLVLWTESDFWPSMLTEIAKRNIPAISINTNMAEKSFRRWQNAPGMIASMLKAFHLVLAANETMAERMRRLGAQNVQVAGNLKYANAPLPFDADKLDALRHAIGVRPMIVWASTHPGENEIAAAQHIAMKDAHPTLLTILVPRHIQKSDGIEEMIKSKGLTLHRRSRDELPKQDTDIYLADTMGELGLFYRLTDFAVIGGSFCFRSHNPIEASQLGCAVFYGPEVAHIEALCEDLENAGAAQRLKDAQALQDRVEAFLSEPSDFAAMSQAGQDWTEKQSHIIENITGALAPFLKHRRHA